MKPEINIPLKAKEILDVYRKIGYTELTAQVKFMEELSSKYKFEMKGLLVNLVDDTELSEWEKLIETGNEFEPDEESKDMTLEELQEEHFKLFGKYAEPPTEAERKK